MRDPETGNSKAFAFINFASFEASDAAIEAMNNQYLCNRPISVSYAFKKDVKGERHGSAAERFVDHLIVFLTDFGHGDQSQRYNLGDILVQNCVRKHRCTLCSFALINRWDGNPTRPEKDQAQDQWLNVLSEARGYHTANFQTPGYY